MSLLRKTIFVLPGLALMKGVLSYLFSLNMNTNSQRIEISSRNQNNLETIFNQGYVIWEPEILAKSNIFATGVITSNRLRINKYLPDLLNAPIYTRDGQSV